MSIDWSQTNLAEGLAPYGLMETETIQKHAASYRADDADITEIFLTLDGLEDYVAAWDIKDGVWLVVACVRMVHEILGDYRASSPGDLPLLGGDPTGELIVLAALEDEQDIAHRIWTAYEELYAILNRMQRKSGEKRWFRRASVAYFPQLRIEVADSDPYDDETSSDNVGDMA